LLAILKTGTSTPHQLNCQVASHKININKKNEKEEAEASAAGRIIKHELY